MAIDFVTSHDPMYTHYLPEAGGVRKYGTARADDATRCRFDHADTRLTNTSSPYIPLPSCLFLRLAIIEIIPPQSSVISAHAHEPVPVFVL